MSDVVVVCRVLESKSAAGSNSGPNNAKTVRILSPTTIAIPAKSSDADTSARESTVHAVYPTPTIPVSQIYSHHISNTVGQCIQSGTPWTLLCYGPDRTGKTTTLCGSSAEDVKENGIFQLTVNDSVDFLLSLQRSGRVSSFAFQLGMITIPKTDIPQDMLCDTPPESVPIEIKWRPGDTPPFPAEEYSRACTGGGVGIPKDGIPIGTCGVALCGATAMYFTDAQKLIDAFETGTRRFPDTKGDRIVVLNVLQQNQLGRISTSCFLFVDCSPVYSKAMHNLRDIVQCCTSSHPHVTPLGGESEFSKSNFTRLLQHSFTRPSVFRLITHCKVSPFDLDIFDSHQSLKFSTQVMKWASLCGSVSIVSATSPSGTARSPVAPLPSTLINVGFVSLPLHLGAGASPKSPLTPSLIDTSQLMRVVDVASSFRKSLHSIEEVSKVVETERAKRKKLEEELAQLKRENHQFSEECQHLRVPMAPIVLDVPNNMSYDCMSPRVTDDIAVFVDSTEEEESKAVQQLLPVSSAIMSPMRGKSPPVPPRSEGIPTEEHYESSNDPEEPRLDKISDDSSDDGGLNGEDVVLSDTEASPFNAEDGTPTDATASPKSIVELLTKVLHQTTKKNERLAAASRLHKTEVERLQGQIAHQKAKGAEVNVLVEAQQRKNQYHLHLATELHEKLENTKKKVRKLKRTVQQEKEKMLPFYNDLLRFDMLCRSTEAAYTSQEYDALIETYEKLSQDYYASCEQIESLESLVHQISENFKEAVTAQVVESDRWKEMIGSLPTLPDHELPFERVTMEHMELRLKGEVLRLNMGGVMQVVEHCYQENARLSNAAAKLTKALADANVRMMNETDATPSDDEVVESVELVDSF